MEIVLEGRDLELARIALEDEVVLPAARGGWRSTDQEVVEERGDLLDLLVTVGRLGDGRKVVAVEGRRVELLRLALRGVHTPLCERALAGDGAAEDDMVAARRLLERLEA